MQGAKWRPRLSFKHLANICRSTYLLDTLFTKFWKNHIKLLHKFIGEMWKQQQHTTTTYEIHFSSCFFFDLSYRPISRQNPEPSNLSPLVRQALLLTTLCWSLVSLKKILRDTETPTHTESARIGRTQNKLTNQSTPQIM